MTTYWLPQHSLSQDDLRGIVRAFCDVFEHCSMWVGGGDNWMMLGVKDGHQRVNAERFRAQWDDKTVAPILAACGFEFPEQLPSYFIADGEALRKLTRNNLPLTDNFPHRLSPATNVMVNDSVYAEYIEHSGAMTRLQQSKHVARLIPEKYIAESQPFFAHREYIHDTFAQPRNRLHPKRIGSIEAIHSILTDSPLSTPVLWSLGSCYRDQLIVDRVAPEKPEHLEVLIRLGHRELANRNYRKASQHYSKFLDGVPKDTSVYQQIMIINAYALCMDSRVDEAKVFLSNPLETITLNATSNENLTFLRQLFPLEETVSVAASNAQ